MTIAIAPAVCACRKTDYQHPRWPATYTCHWSWGNTKLAKDHTVSFGLPAFRSAHGFRVCPQAGTCAAVCYARQGNYRRATVQTFLEHNLAWLRAHPLAAFVAACSTDIAQLHPSWQRVRIHHSGDFFTPAYLDAWAEIARQHATIPFYGYTKQIRLLQRVQSSLPPNLHLVQSVGGKEDRWIDPALPHAIIFPDVASLEEAGYVNATHSDAPVYGGAVKIGLVYHGTDRLSAPNAARLRTSARPIVGAYAAPLVPAP